MLQSVSFSSIEVVLPELAGDANIAGTVVARMAVGFVEKPDGSHRSFL